MRHMVLVVLLWGCSKDPKNDGGGSAAAKPPPSTEAKSTEATPVATRPPEPAKPPGRPPPDAAQVRKGMTTSTKTQASPFSCPGAGYFDLRDNQIKSFKVTSSNVDGDYAIVMSEISLQRSGPFDHIYRGKGMVKLRYHWEAEWVLIERDSSAMKCTDSPPGK